MPIRQLRPEEQEGTEGRPTELGEDEGIFGDLKAKSLEGIEDSAFVGERMLAPPPGMDKLPRFKEVGQVSFMLFSCVVIWPHWLLA